jgi:hypothetical protein
MSQRFLLLLLIGLPFWAISQGINGGFETISPNGIPSGWSIADPSGAATTKDAHIGKVAAKAWVYKNYESGIWSNRLDPSQGNASEVTGYYKYEGDKSECDRATVSYLLGARNAEGQIDTLAWGSTELKVSKDYRKFSLSVSSTGSGTPEFAHIQIQPNGHCNIHGETNCCFLFVDDVILAGSTSVKSAPDPEPMIEEEPEERNPDPVLEEESESQDTMAPIMEGKGALPSEVEEGNAREDAVPADEEGKEEAPVEKEAVPADEETAIPETENNEPVDEDWDSEEESSDGGR